ncbi:hypothetical protein COB57_05665 [Candidatus Peregrinibacteria bacterium]|nr:MAG: hypothetical protein COB57_05665 [Candidatus Peregrinibacteria bacterium]
MQTYISLLRGINVAGKKKIHMAALKHLYEKLGLKEVKTYIQSGNVSFQSKNSNPHVLVKLIEKAIKQRYQFEVPVFIKTVKDFEDLIKNAPFKEDDTEESRYITFCSQTVNPDAWKVLEKFQGKTETFSIEGKEVYLYLPAGYSKSRLTNNFLEKKLKTVVTTRNWKTVKTLVELNS